MTVPDASTGREYARGDAGPDPATSAWTRPGDARMPYWASLPAS